jgi:hypothetical protein
MAARLAALLVALLPGGVVAAPPEKCASPFDRALPARFFALPKLADSVKAGAAGNQLGTHRDLPSAAVGQGRWITRDGRRLWTLGLKSPGAKALRVHFTGLTEGRLWISAAANCRETGGPYRNGGPTRNGEFWSDVIAGEAVLIVWEPPPGVRSIGFRIDRISHLWRTLEQ